MPVLLAFVILFGIVPFAGNEAYAAGQYRTLRNKTVGGKDLCVNLRAMLGEKAGRGYSVVQGGCTDGKYAYYLMVSSQNQRGRVLKVRLKDHAVVKRGPVVDVHHGNGMAYDSKRRRLVVVGCESRRCELVTIDAGTLRLKAKKKIDYSAARNWNVRSGNSYYGLSAISYIPKYDCFVALQRRNRDLLVLDPGFKVIGLVNTNILSKYSGTYQAMDADEKYVYLLLSEDQEKRKRQPYNLILALDWNSENLLPYVSRAVPGFAKVWNCNDNNSGRADAVIRLRTRNEAENLYHTTDKNGKEHFYLAEYCPYSNYRYVTKTVKQKVKWRQIKQNGKLVWQYKTKNVKKKVKKGIKKAYRKDSYVYYLGVI